jgi:hypothetical protein
VVGFPREDFRVVRIEELKLLYAMIKKKKVSPVKLMLHCWLTIPRIEELNLLYALLHFMGDSFG